MSEQLDADEDVLDTGRPRRSLPRWGWAVLVLVAAAGLWFATGRSTGPPHPATTSTPVAQPAPTRPSASPHLPSFRALSGQRCGGAGTCAVTAELPGDLARAVRHYLPRAERTSTVSAIQRAAPAVAAALIGRTVETHVASSTLLVSVQVYQHTAGDTIRPLAPTPPGVNSAFVSIETPSFRIVMQWIASSDSVVPFTALRALAEDPRLEALP